MQLEILSHSIFPRKEKKAYRNVVLDQPPLKEKPGFLGDHGFLRHFARDYKEKEESRLEP